MIFMAFVPCHLVFFPNLWELQASRWGKSY